MVSHFSGGITEMQCRNQLTRIEIIEIVIMILSNICTATLKRAHPVNCKMKFSNAEFHTAQLKVNNL